MAVPEALFTFLEVLTEDADLRAWFESFADTPAASRSLEMAQLAARMQAAGEAPELVQATALLANAGIYEAVLASLREDGATAE